MEYEPEQNFESNNQQEEKENVDQFNNLKMYLRKMPRKSSNTETKIREIELLNSLFQDNSKPSVQHKGHTKYKTKLQESPQKSCMTLAAAILNENVKKQTYKIKFKVKLSSNSSKSSVLQYLFGCFGGEKLFNQQK